MKKSLIFYSIFAFLVLCIGCNKSTSDTGKSENSKDTKKTIEESKQDVQKKVEDTKKSLKDSSDKVKKDVKNTYGAVPTSGENKPEENGIVQKVESSATSNTSLNKEESLKEDLTVPSTEGISQQVVSEKVEEVTNSVAPSEETKELTKVEEQGDSFFEDEENLFEDKDEDSFKEEVTQSDFESENS